MMHRCECWEPCLRARRQIAPLRGSVKRCQPAFDIHPRLHAAPKHPPLARARNSSAPRRACARARTRQQPVAAHARAAAHTSRRPRAAIAPRLREGSRARADRAPTARNDRVHTGPPTLRAQTSAHRAQRTLSPQLCLNSAAVPIKGHCLQGSSSAANAPARRALRSGATNQQTMWALWKERPAAPARARMHARPRFERKRSPPLTSTRG